MSFIPAMWTVWAALVLLSFALKIYVSRLTRDEDDQLVLHDSFSRVKDEQAAMVAKVSKVEPVEHAVFWVLGATSLFVIGYYVLDMINRLSR